MSIKWEIWSKTCQRVKFRELRLVLILPAHSESVGYKNNKLCRVTSNRYSWKRKVESVRFKKILRITYSSSNSWAQIIRNKRQYINSLRVTVDTSSITATLHGVIYLSQIRYKADFKWVTWSYRHNLKKYLAGFYYLSHITLLLTCICTLLRLVFTQFNALLIN